MEERAMNRILRGWRMLVCAGLGAVLLAWSGGGKSAAQQKGETAGTAKLTPAAEAYLRGLTYQEYLLGLGHEERGEFEQAIKAFSEAIERDADFASAYYHRGMCHWWRGANKEALRDFNKAVQLDKRMVLPQFMRGATHAMMNDSEKALADLDAAVKGTSEFFMAHMVRGTLRRYDDDEKAVDDFTAMIRIAPDNPFGYLLRSASYGMMGEREKADADLAKAHKLRYPLPQRPRRVEAPSIDAAAAAARAIEIYDRDGDGMIGGTELDAVPVFKYQPVMARVDKNGDGKVSKDEIKARIIEWQESKVGLMSYACKVVYKTADRPRPVALQGARVVYEPEPFLGKYVKAAKGTTGPGGMASVGIPDIEFQACQVGYYKVRITHDTIKIPAKYNTKTTLGDEIAQDAAAGEESDRVFELEL